MAKSLVIVESPAKAKTINKFLGRNYIVRASMGHVRDLPKSKLGVDVENGLRAGLCRHSQEEEDPLGAQDRGAQGRRDLPCTRPRPLKAKRSASHLAEELRSKDGKIYRILFNEITKKAIQEAIKNPLQIDQDKVDAQQARRVLDRLVGYQISPLLWGEGPPWSLSGTRAIP